MKARVLALSSLFIASIVLLTMWPSFPIAFIGGYFNFGDVLVMSMGLVLGWPYALLAGVGAALADILLGWGQYAFFTLIIKGIEASIITLLVRKNAVKLWVYILAGSWMAFGYGLSDVFIGSSLGLFVPSFLANIMQGVLCALIAFGLQPLFIRLKRNTLKL